MITMQALVSDRRFKVVAFSLLLSEFVRCLGYNLYTLSMPLLAQDMTLGMPGAPILIGVAVGVFGLMQAVCQIPLGRLSDRIGRRDILIVSGFVYAFGALMTGFAQNIFQFILFRMIQATGAIVSVIQACLGDIFPVERRGTAMAWFSIVYAVGTLVGIPLGGIITATLGLRFPFYICSVLAFVAAFILVAFLRETLPAKCVKIGASIGTQVSIPVSAHVKSSRRAYSSDSDATAEGNPSSLPSSEKYYRVTGFAGTCVIAVATSFTMGSFFAFAPIFLTSMGFTLDETLLFFIPGIIIYFIGSLVSGVWSDHQGRRTPIVFGLIIGIPWFLFVPFTPNSLLPPIIILGLLGVAVAQTPLSALLLDLVPKEVRGNASGFYNTLTILGTAVGSVLSGFIVEFLGQGMLFASSGVLLALSLPVGLAFLPRRQTKTI
jgi:MFS family permease